MKKIINLLIVFISVFFLKASNCYASTNTFDRNKLDNYGVNKAWEINKNNKTKVLNTPAVDANEKIYDYADVLTEEEEKSLKKSIDKFIEVTKMDMVIVIPDFEYYADYQNEEYAADFYDYNDFGMKYENNSGVLFLRNANNNDPYYNIYTFGNAQLYFSHDRLENTLDNIYNAISEKNYLTGFNQYINEMTKYYKAGIPYSMRGYKVDEKGYLYEVYAIPWLWILGIALILTIITMAILIANNKMIKKSTHAAEYLNKESFEYTNKKNQYVRSHTSSYIITSSSGSSGGGGFSSHSGSSGGGHSSGGGRHG